MFHPNPLHSPQLIGKTLKKVVLKPRLHHHVVLGQASACARGGGGEGYHPYHSMYHPYHARYHPYHLQQPYLPIMLRDDSNENTCRTGDPPPILPPFSLKTHLHMFLGPQGPPTKGPNT